jgi:predicted small secreted protein
VTPKEIIMRRIQLLLAVGLSAMLLAACHTTAGAGRDISAAGNAITHPATEHSY